MGRLHGLLLSVEAKFKNIFLFYPLFPLRFGCADILIKLDVLIIDDFDILMLVGEVGIIS